MGTNSIINKIKYKIFKPYMSNKILKCLGGNKDEIAYLSDYDLKLYRNNFKKAIKDFANNNEKFMIMAKIIKNFANSHITSETKNWVGSQVNPKSPILVTVIKDDIIRCKLLLTYYRSIGVKYFAILDNGSTDGTFELLKQQKDVNLFKCVEEYETYRKEAWVNRIISNFGFNRWYLIVDSDEMIDYIGREEQSIETIIDKLEKQNFTRGKGMLIDMYSKGNLFEVDCDYKDIPNRFSYFDYKGYHFETKSFVPHWEGGPRERVLDSKHIWVSKSPLLYMNSDTVVINAHFQSPLSVDRESPEIFFIKHYKYLKQDYLPFKTRVEKKNFSNDSKFYKSAVEKFSNGDDISFFYADSMKFNSSDDIKIFTNIRELV